MAIEPWRAEPPAARPDRPAGRPDRSGASRPRRWPWVAVLLGVVTVAAAVALVPNSLMRPFLPQSPAVMALAYALRRLGPAATLAALAAGVLLAWRLWGSTRWVGRVLLAAALLPLGAACWFSRQNVFEWLFPPLTRPGYARAVAADFVEPGDPVLAIQIQGDTVAYPVRQVAYHHVVEDVVGGTPVAVTY